MNNKMTINELRQFIRDVINEGMGMPNVIKNIVNLSNKLFNENNNGKICGSGDSRYVESKIVIDGNNINDSFFNDLIIVVREYDSDSQNLHSFYVPKLSEWDVVNNKFDIFYITISLNKDNLYEFSEKLTHELLHAYEDYKRILKGRGFNNLDQERITVDGDRLTNINRYMIGRLLPIKAMIYLNLDTEKRANIAQFYAELNKNEITINSIKNNSYKNLSGYNIYKNMYNTVSNLIDNLNTNEINILIDYCIIMNLGSIINRNESETITEKDFKNRFIKYIQTGANNTMIKMDKIVWEYINDVHDETK